jgi:hypothetical protein
MCTSLTTVTSVCKTLHNGYGYPCMQTTGYHVLKCAVSNTALPHSHMCILHVNYMSYGLCIHGVHEHGVCKTQTSTSARPDNATWSQHSLAQPANELPSRKCTFDSDTLARGVHRRAALRTR